MKHQRRYGIPAIVWLYTTAFIALLCFAPLIEGCAK